MQNNASVTMVNTSLIVPNKYQPRKFFDETELDKLAESIKQYGIINPILARKKDDKYEIIAGERRFRAAKKIGLTEVPVIIKNADEQQMAELALIENLNRQELTPIEEAKSYVEIMRIGNQTQQTLAQKLGKSQSSIANKIRLLSLPQEVIDALTNKKISERHARSLLTVQDKNKQLELLNRIINERLTVKETDQIINTREITNTEIKQAINDIMKSLNIQDDETSEYEENKKEEKEDDNMNNGNFFPNFDNNNAANNNASLNTMNMQSMNMQTQVPEQEVVMPTIQTPMPNQTPGVSAFDQFNPNMQESAVNLNINPNPIPTFDMTPNNVTVNNQASMDQPMINDAPLFGPQLNSTPQPEPLPEMTTPMMDTPLFNPNVTMPSATPNITAPEMPELSPQEPQANQTPSFEVPVTEQPAPVVDKFTQLQDFLNANGYSYKTYSNETTDCLIIEMPKN